MNNYHRQSRIKLIFDIPEEKEGCLSWCGELLIHPDVPPMYLGSYKYRQHSSGTNTPRYCTQECADKLLPPVKDRK